MIVEQRLSQAQPKSAQDNTAKGGRPARTLFVPNRQLKLREQVREQVREEMRFFHH